MTTDPRALTALAEVFTVDGGWQRLSDIYRRAHDAVATLAAAGFSIVPAGLLTEVAAERASQDARWGEQNHPNGTGLYQNRAAATRARMVCDRNAELGTVTWADILREEFCEALAESDPALLRAELVQVAAVATAWAEAVDRAALAVSDPCPGCHPDRSDARERYRCDAHRCETSTHIA